MTTVVPLNELTIDDAFHGNLKAMLDDSRRRQAASGRPEWSPLAIIT